MLRRRCPKKNEAIHFSFDSFLDLVTNIVGIIIRLILATWIGARAYHASMQWIATEPDEQAQHLPAPKLTDEPLYSKMEIAKLEMEDAKRRLLDQLKEVETVESKTKQAKDEIFILSDRENDLQTQRKKLQAALSERDGKIQLVSLSVEDIRQRTKKLLAEIKKVEAQPLKTKQFKYHAPVSQAVRSDEVHFECKNGRVTFIDLPALEMEINRSMDGVGPELRNQSSVEHTTSPVGPFRLRYIVERDKGSLEAGRPSGSGMRYGLAGWVVEAITPERGETLDGALKAKSDFRQMVDPLDGNLTTVTFWVYPESFEMFRKLRDYLYERGLDVAGRPLPRGAPIAGSRYGTASRGQ